MPIICDPPWKLITAHQQSKGSCSESRFIKAGALTQGWSVADYLGHHFSRNGWPNTRWWEAHGKWHCQEAYKWVGRILHDTKQGCSEESSQTLLWMTGVNLLADLFTFILVIMQEAQKLNFIHGAGLTQDMISSHICKTLSYALFYIIYIYFLAKENIAKTVCISALNLQKLYYSPNICVCLPPCLSQSAGSVVSEQVKCWPSATQVLEEVQPQGAPH